MKRIHFNLIVILIYSITTLYHIQFILIEEDSTLLGFILSSLFVVAFFVQFVIAYRVNDIKSLCAHRNFLLIQTLIIIVVFLALAFNNLFSIILLSNFIGFSLMMVFGACFYGFTHYLKLETLLYFSYLFSFSLLWISFARVGRLKSL